MKQVLLWRSVLAGFLAVFISMSAANRLRTRMGREALEQEHKNDTLQRKNSFSEIKVKLNKTYRTLNDSSKWTFVLNTTGIPDGKFNSSDKKVSTGCHGDESPAICHTYIHNMYQFYSTVSRDM